MSELQRYERDVEFESAMIIAHVKVELERPIDI